MTNLTVHTGTITWNNFEDISEVEQVLVFRINGVDECAMRANGMEITPSMVDISINEKAKFAFLNQNEDAVQDLIHDLFVGDNDEILESLWAI